jgi:predicted DNA-binding transcriptional regulator YafY
VRILGILKILAEGGRPTVYELAGCFKTRRETIYRDIDASRDQRLALASRSSTPGREPEGGPDENHRSRVLNDCGVA